MQLQRLWSERSSKEVKLLSYFGNIDHIRTLPITSQLITNDFAHPSGVGKIHHSCIETELMLIQQHTEGLQAKLSLSTEVRSWLWQTQGIFSKLRLNPLNCVDCSIWEGYDFTATQHWGNSNVWPCSQYSIDNIRTCSSNMKTCKFVFFCSWNTLLLPLRTCRWHEQCSFSSKIFVA